LGSGDAFQHDGRGSQSIWIEPTVGAPLLVDAGPTAVHAMMRFGERPERLDRVLFTHHHGDHIAGWPFLLLHLVQGTPRHRPLEVHGPSGIRQRLERLAGACFDDALRPTTFDLRYHEWTVERRAGLSLGDGTLLDLYPMRHHASSTGLRLQLDGLRVGVSGDTGWCDELERLTRASDVTVLECTTVRPESATHLSLQEIREWRGRLGAGELLLVHLTDRVAEELAVDPIPGVTAAYDGLEWSPPPEAG
jgi:ribonuclease BN (tRNA processing enzyme)